MIKNKYRKLIIASWIALIICFVLKIFGGNFFEIICENQHFINFCKFLDNNLIFKYAVSTFVYVPSTYLIYLAITKQRFTKDWWIMIIALPCSICKGYIPILGILIELLILVIIPLIKLGFKSWKTYLRVVIGIGLIFIFQAISLFARNLGIYLTDESMLVGLIMTIDYYIMIALYYLYSNREERK